LYDPLIDQGFAMKYINLEQTTYSSAPVGWGPEGGARGFKFVSKSRGLTRFDDLDKCREYRLPQRIGTDGRPKEIPQEERPIDWGWVHSDQDRVLIYRKCSGLRDEIGREGNWFAQIFIASKQEMEWIDYEIPLLFQWIGKNNDPFVSGIDGFPRNAFEVYERHARPIYESLLGDTESLTPGSIPFFEKLVRNSKNISQQLDRGPLGEIDSIRIPLADIRKLGEERDAAFVDQILTPLIGRIGLDAIYKILHALLVPQDQMRPVLLRGFGEGREESLQERQITDLLFALLPYHWRRDLTFSTAPHAKDDIPVPRSFAKRIMMITKDVEYDLSKCRHGMYVIDAISQSSDSNVLPQTISPEAEYVSDQLRTRDWNTLLHYRRAASCFDFSNRNDAFSCLQAMGSTGTVDQPDVPVTPHTYTEWVVAARENAYHFPLLTSGKRLIQDIVSKGDFSLSTYETILQLTKDYLDIQKKHITGPSEDFIPCIQRLIETMFRTVLVNDPLTVSRFVISLLSHDLLKMEDVRSAVLRLLKLQLKSQHSTNLWRNLLVLCSMLEKPTEEYSRRTPSVLESEFLETLKRIAYEIFLNVVDSLGEDQQLQLPPDSPIFLILEEVPFEANDEIGRRLQVIQSVQMPPAECEKLERNLLYGLAKRGRLTASTAHAAIDAYPETLVNSYTAWLALAEAKDSPWNQIERQAMSVQEQNQHKSLRQRLCSPQLLKKYSSSPPTRKNIRSTIAFLEHVSSNTNCDYSSIQQEASKCSPLFLDSFEDCLMSLTASELPDCVSMHISLVRTISASAGVAGENPRDDSHAKREQITEECKNVVTKHLSYVVREIIRHHQESLSSAAYCKALCHAAVACLDDVLGESTERQNRIFALIAFACNAHKFQPKDCSILEESVEQAFSGKTLVEHIQEESIRRDLEPLVSKTPCKRLPEILATWLGCVAYETGKRPGCRDLNEICSHANARLIMKYLGRNDKAFSSKYRGTLEKVCPAVWKLMGEKSTWDQVCWHIVRSIVRSKDVPRAVVNWFSGDAQSVRKSVLDKIIEWGLAEDLVQGVVQSLSKGESPQTARVLFDFANNLPTEFTDLLKEGASELDGYLAQLLQQKLGSLNQERSSGSSPDALLSLAAPIIRVLGTGRPLDNLNNYFVRVGHRIKKRDCTLSMFVRSFPDLFRISVSNTLIDYYGDGWDSENCWMQMVRPLLVDGSPDDVDKGHRYLAAGAVALYREELLAKGNHAVLHEFSTFNWLQRLHHVPLSELDLSAALGTSNERGYEKVKQNVLEVLKDLEKIGSTVPNSPPIRVAAGAVLADIATLEGNQHFGINWASSIQAAMKASSPTKSQRKGHAWLEELTYLLMGVLLSRSNIINSVQGYKKTAVTIGKDLRDRKSRMGRLNKKELRSLKKIASEVLMECQLSRKEIKMIVGKL
jgi:hypothetical protein